MGRIVYRKRIKLDTYDGLLRDIADKIKTHAQLMAYLADVPPAERLSFVEKIEPLTEMTVNWEWLEQQLGPRDLWANPEARFTILTEDNFKRLLEIEE